MSLTISSSYARPLPASPSSAQAIRDQGVRPHDNTRVAPAAPAPAQALRAPSAAPGAAAALPVEPPAGTDPALWSILSSEERSFFAKSQASGPFTYGRVMAGLTQPSL